MDQLLAGVMMPPVAVTTWNSIFWRAIPHSAVATVKLSQWWAPSLHSKGASTPSASPRTISRDSPVQLVGGFVGGGRIGPMVNAERITTSTITAATIPTGSQISRCQWPFGDRPFPGVAGGAGGLGGLGGGPTAHGAGPGPS